MSLWGGCFETPIGLLTVVVDGGGAIKHLHFGRLDLPGLRHDEKAVAPVRDQIEAYFAGERRHFDLALAPDGTAFQRAVWDGLLTIPYGRTLSYGALAERVGRPGAFRAVGAANGANPIALIIPCHRVIGGDRTLTGYGRGIAIKAALLAHEGVLPKDLAALADRRTKIDLNGSLWER